MGPHRLHRPASSVVVRGATTRCRPERRRARRIGGPGMTERCAPVDVAIVGLGAAGGVAAHVLTEAGLDVAGIEAGPRMSSDDFRFDELHNDVHAHLSQPKAAHEVPTWRSDPDAAAGPSPWAMLMVNAVGGTSVHYEAMSFRFNRWTFEARSQVVGRYGEAALPAGSTLED